MCQGSCSANSRQQACSPADAHLRLALADIKKLAEQHLQALQPACNPSDKSEPPTFALHLIATRAEAALAALPAPVAEKPVTMHRPGQLSQLSAQGCGCRSTTECRCRAMDITASLLYRSHEHHRKPASSAT